MKLQASALQLRQLKTDKDKLSQNKEKVGLEERNGG
jgi:hypothetical protein